MLRGTSRPGAKVIFRRRRGNRKAARLCSRPRATKGTATGRREKPVTRVTTALRWFRRMNPHEKAEDPMGIQRPFDREGPPRRSSAALGDMLSRAGPKRDWSGRRAAPKEVLCCRRIRRHRHRACRPVNDVGHESQLTLPRMGLSPLVRPAPSERPFAYPPETGLRRSG